jgi:hypothetical protein
LGRFLAVFVGTGVLWAIALSLPARAETPDLQPRIDRAIAEISSFWGENRARGLEIAVDPRESRSKTVYGARTLISLSPRSAAPSSSTLEHEIAHAVVGPDGARRAYLMEGVATYFEYAYGPVAFGIDDWARAQLKRHPFVSLEGADVGVGGGAVATPARMLAYAEAGSFVKFLIESRGLSPFKRLYSGLDYAAVYGRDLRDLQSEWLRGLLPTMEIAER